MLRPTRNAISPAPIELPDPASEAASKQCLLETLASVLDGFSFSTAIFLNESLIGVESPAQDRGYRLSIVLEGSKTIGYAKAGRLFQTTISAPACIFANEGAWQTASLDSPFLVFGIVLESKYTRFLQVRNLGPGQPPGERHFYHTERPPSPALRDSAALLTRSLALGALNPQSRHWLFGSLVALAREELLESSHGKKQDRPTGVAHRKWEAIQQYLIDHFHEPIDRQELSREFGLTPSYLSQLYKRFANVSFSSSLLKLRLDHAANLLAHSRQSISEIAYRSGFNDTSYFTRAFQKRFGKTPSAYRLEAKR